MKIDNQLCSKNNRSYHWEKNLPEVLASNSVTRFSRAQKRLAVPTIDVCLEAGSSS